MKLVTSAQMRAVDREAIENQGIPGPELMEHAGRGIAEGILENLIENPDETTAVIFCGKGNNGGDGFVIGRYLHQAGVNVVIFYIGSPDKMSPDARLNFDRAGKLGLDLFEVKSIEELPEELDCDIIVDAVFGTGFEGVPRGLTKDLIEYINWQDAHIVAVDMPSGLNADNGQHEGAVVAADYTFTLCLPKYGLYLSPGRELSGTVETVPIGVPDEIIEKFNFKNELITPEYVFETLPERAPDAHKGDFGKLFILAGSTGLTGAASMAGESAARSGAGLVK
ncbi:MAG: NAD(P)H-hydrate epimerase, partial [candidate division Zixibacteria bacterium]|nr:NAD(P)H-hydrate epimerase [candidate division Zixibacteria bacterium]